MMTLDTLLTKSALTLGMDFRKVEGFSDKKELNIKTKSPLKDVSKSVYVFEHKDDGIVYIGSSRRTGNKTQQEIRIRITQGYSPYKLIDDRLYFLNYDKPMQGRQYNDYFKLSDITIHYYDMGNVNKFFTIPTALMYFLLQLFHNENHRLPIINNKA